MKENGLFSSLIRRFKNRKNKDQEESAEEGQVLCETAAPEVTDSEAVEPNRISGPVGETMISDEQAPSPDQSRMTEEYAEWLKSQAEWNSGDDAEAGDEPERSMQPETSAEEAEVPAEEAETPTEETEVSTMEVKVPAEDAEIPSEEAEIPAEQPDEAAEPSGEDQLTE